MFLFTSVSWRQKARWSNSVFLSFSVSLWSLFTPSRNSEYKVFADTHPNSTGEGGPKDTVIISENRKVRKDLNILNNDEAVARSQQKTYMEKRSYKSPQMQTEASAPADTCPDTEVSAGPSQKPRFVSLRAETRFNSAFWMAVDGLQITSSWHDMLLLPFSSCIASGVQSRAPWLRWPTATIPAATTRNEILQRKEKAVFCLGAGAQELWNTGAHLCDTNIPFVTECICAVLYI